MSFGWLVFVAERSGTFILLVAAGALLGRLTVGAVRFGRATPTYPLTQRETLAAEQRGEGKFDRFWGATLGAIAVAALSMLPVGAVSAFTFLFSILGPLSVAGLFALAGMTAWSFRVLPQCLARDSVLAAGILAALGMALYTKSH